MANIVIIRWKDHKKFDIYRDITAVFNHKFKLIFKMSQFLIIV